MAPSSFERARGVKFTSNLNKISIAIEYKNRLVLMGFRFNDFVPLAPDEAVKKT